ncbi:MAG TPA: YebC/PmpR family DNA-binding transcriptional regulator, partial [Patescibacteria group bacterium]|nr:YebC/PmpR family DNA-binding transcriptional regulator [Patescibacteria group bacterium]
MSGHSKWATIHRQKGVKDAKRGALFSKLARAITIAAKLGSGPDPGSNFKLRMAIDRAKAENMPKSNIERAIASAEGSGKLEEVIYEGFGPEGIAVMMEVTTDNRNRTGQEIKNIFERGGG